MYQYWKTHLSIWLVASDIFDWFAVKEIETNSHQNYEEGDTNFVDILNNYIKVKRKVQRLPQSQTAALPRPQEKEETDKSKQAQTEQTYEKH